MSTRFINLTKQQFGHWRVLAIHPERDHRGLILWRCVCACGTERLVRGDGLREGRSKNCGCVRREKLKKLTTKHGMTGTRAYVCWQDMLARCHRESHRWFSHYGARGITVCEEWLSFENFYADMGDPPDGLSIHRIDNDGPYALWNCKWATRTEQRANQRPPRRKGRRASAAEIRAFADSLARAASGRRAAP
jgi:hypothetical protein